jgi:hypothetical protein
VRGNAFTVTLSQRERDKCGPQPDLLPKERGDKGGEGPRNKREINATSIRERENKGDEGQKERGSR